MNYLCIKLAVLVCGSYKQSQSLSLSLSLLSELAIVKIEI